MNPDPVLTGSGSDLFSDVGSGSGPNPSGSATLLESIKVSKNSDNENFSIKLK
jgi:hypothetical protein